LTASSFSLPDFSWARRQAISVWTLCISRTFGTSGRKKGKNLAMNECSIRIKSNDLDISSASKLSIAAES